MGIGGGSCMMIMIHIRFCIIDFLTLPSRVSRTSDCCSPVSEARTMDSLACMHHAQVSADFMTVRSGCSGNGAPGPRLSLSLRFDNEKRSGQTSQCISNTNTCGLCGLEALLKDNSSGCRET
jgi:hypothetical protein